MSNNNTRKSSEINERLSALIGNASAIRAISGAVEGTIGPKGLDTMLVDESGDIVITNAGVTILDRMEVNHPAARMLINIARAQHEEIGDGTTTATIMAGTLVSEGLNRIIKGVPVTRVIEGIRKGAQQAISEIKSYSIPVKYPDDPMLTHVALIAGRGYSHIAGGVTKAAKMLGKNKLMEPSFRLKDIIKGLEGAENQVFEGIIIKKRPLNDAMPRVLENCRVLCLDDALEAEKPQQGALNTEAGFNLYMKNERDFLENLKKIPQNGIGVVLIEQGISDQAESFLTDAGVMVLTRLSSGNIRTVCEHTGAKAVKKSILEKNEEEIGKHLGSAEKIHYDKKHKCLQILKGGGVSMATYIVGAPTYEVAQEKERIAGDAACAVQAAIRGGVVPGGGAVEIAVSRKIEEYRKSIPGMSAFGVDCVVEALRRPMTQIITNAGFNSLEKLEEVIKAQSSTDKSSLGIDCETGEICDMMSNNIVDPTLVKLHALKAAAEVSEAILRINTIVKMRTAQVPDNFKENQWSY